MPALNFQERFAAAVESGEKRQTIRRAWKRPIKVGDMLYLYTGMRTKRCEGIGQYVCKSVRTIKFTLGTISIDEETYCFGQTHAAHHFAKADGFDSWPEMRNWFSDRYGLPFEGVLIEW